MIALNFSAALICNATKILLLDLAPHIAPPLHFNPPTSLTHSDNSVSEVLFQRISLVQNTSRTSLPLEIDTCLFTKEGIILVLYVDDAILISPYQSLIQKEIVSMQKDYDLTDDGELKDYLGTRFIKRPNGSIELTMPKMIDRILNIVGLDSTDTKIKMHDTPADPNNILDKDPNAKPRKQSWNYRSAVGALSYLHSMIRPDCTFAVQQCARFCNDPSQEHEEAVKRICRYLLRTRERGIVMKPDKRRGLECMVDADWAGSWRDRSSHDPLSAHSRTGYILLYAGCPIAWKSSLQPLISLSTTEAEYCALSTALREVISIMHLLEELRLRNFQLNLPTPKIVCRTFEDNKSCIEITTNHKTRARTKHLSVRLHHFRHHIVNKTITIEHISTKEQLGDAFTKPLERKQFRYLTNKIMGWEDDIHDDDKENVNPILTSPNFTKLKQHAAAATAVYECNACYHCLM